MKVAIIIERSDVFLGGAERSVFELSSALSQAGVDVTLLAAKGQQNAKHVHVLCNHLAGARTDLTVFANECIAYLSENHFDIVHSVLPFDFADIYQPRGGSYPEAIIQNAVSYNNTFVEQFKRVTSFFNFRRGALANAECRLCRNPNGPVIAALSHYVANQFKRHYRLADHRIAVIPNGVKTDKTVDASEFAEIRNSIWQQYPPEVPNPVILLFAANNFRLKGLYPLLEAMSAAIAQGANLHLAIAGNEHSGQCRREARKLQLEGNIGFLGPVSHIQNALAISDVAVLPTFYDPASRFILEALAYGKPVITTAFNGSSDLFKNDVHGISIDDPRNIPALTNALLHYSNRSNVEASCKAIIADNVKDTVSIGRHVNELIELYGKVLERKKHK